VLGLCSFTHDSAAALISGGSLTGMAEEERLSGVKHTRDYPDGAVRWLLDDAGISTADVDIVAYNFDGYRYLGGITGSARYLFSPVTCSHALPRAASFAVVHRRFRGRMQKLRETFPNARVRGTLHHKAHGLYAYAASGFSEAAVLVVDSLGETCTTSIAAASRTGDRVQYRAAETISDPASLGYAYGAVTAHLGWRRGDEEGTVMALAALGDPARFRDLLARAIPLTRTGFALDPSVLPLRVLRSGWPRVTPAFTTATCPARDPAEDITQVHADLAAALQERTEQVITHLARRARSVTGAGRLCVAGGVAMNCVSIGKVISSGLFEEVYVPPAPGDSGTAIGAALAAYRDAAGVLPGGPVGACYLGPAYPGFTPEAPPGMSARQVAEPTRFLAAQLAEGKIAGLFLGRLEAGPRALGNRSILASPLVPDVAVRLNAAVKFREPFRPFAPVVLADPCRRLLRSGPAQPFHVHRRPRHRPGPGHDPRRGPRQRHRPRPDPRPAAQPVPRRRPGLLRGTDRRACPDQHLAQRQGQADQRHPADGARLPRLQRARRADARQRLVGEPVRIGYSFWGFLGPGITDTPDGGRSHRATLIDGLIAAGHDIVFLQPNRDLDEADCDLTSRYHWDQRLPEIDALFLEWRWPINGRNTTPCGTPGHTCDLHGQDELLAHYTLGNRTQTMLWDKDRRLPAASPLRSAPGVSVCEPALAPSPGAVSLLFPIADDALDSADPAALAAMPRPLPLAYVGNQYDRDAAFAEFFVPAAARHQHRVAGKWTRTAQWPHVTFTGRIAFPDVRPLYESALATILLLPRPVRQGRADDPADLRGRPRRLPAPDPGGAPVRLRVHSGSAARG
jgi:carbamoyltransferase